MKEELKKNLFEEDLYIPVRDYLQKQGYAVKSEVNHCDVTAIKDDVLLVVEMKLTLNLDVILQAVIRQRMAEIVYIAVPKKDKVLNTKRWNNICHLLRRLEMGLLLVSIKEKGAFVEEALVPKVFNRQVSKSVSARKRASVIKEFEARYADFNTGGCTRKKIVTAYREMAIHMAVLLKKHGPLKIKQLKEMGTDAKKTSVILQDNYYGWFDRVSKGVYILNTKGEEEVAGYSELVEYYEKT